MHQINILEGYSKYFTGNVCFSRAVPIHAEMYKNEKASGTMSTRSSNDQHLANASTVSSSFNTLCLNQRVRWGKYGYKNQ